MNILNFFKKHNNYNIKDIKELPDEYRTIIYNLRPEHTLLNESAFINLYTSVLIDDDLYLSDVSKADNYISWLKKPIRTAQMVEFIYSKNYVLKNRFGSYDKYIFVENCKNYKLVNNEFCCIQWSGENLQEVFDFCGGSWHFINKFFDGDWGKFASYVREHENIFKVWYSEDYHRCAYPGDYLVRFIDGNILIVKQDVFEENFKENVNG